jgi:hypothetical protein
LLVLVATGASLFLEASAKQTAGIVLLGLAATWFVGSIGLRTLGLILSVTACGVGLYVAVSPIWRERESVRASAQEFDSAIAAIREAVAKADVYEIVPPDEWDKYKVAPKKLPAGFFDGYDVVRHPTLGTLKFPKAMPYDERNRLIKKWEAAKPLQPPPGYRVDPYSERVVEIPAAALRWLHPDRFPGGTLVSVAFPSSESNEEILRHFQTEILRPRPTFSVKASLRTNLGAVLLGLSLVMSGMLGCAWLTRAMLRARRQRFVTTP